MTRYRIAADASYTIRPFAGRTVRVVDSSIGEGFEPMYEVQLDPPRPYDPESLWVEPNELEEVAR